MLLLTKSIFWLFILIIPPAKEEPHQFQNILDSVQFYIPHDLGKADSFIQIIEKSGSLESQSKIKADYFLAKGAISGRTGRSFSAIKQLYQALSIYEQLQDIDKIIKTKFEICYNHHLLEEHQTAIKIAAEAMALCKLTKNTGLLYRGQYNLGRAYGWSQDNTRLKKDTDTLQMALHHFMNARSFIQDWGDSLAYFPLFRGLGDAYYKLGNYKKAEKYFRILEKHDNPNSKYLSAIYFGMINRARGKITNAYQNYHKAEQYALSSKNDFALEWVSREISRLYSDTGNYRKALKYRQQSEELYIKRIKANKNGAVASLTLAYEKEQRETQLAFQQQLLKIQQSNLRYQKNIIVAIASGLLVSFVLVVFYYHSDQKNKRMSVKNAYLVREQNHRVKNNLQMLSALLNMQSRHLKDQKARDAFSESNLRITSIGLIHQMLYGNNLEKIEMKDFVIKLTTYVVDTFSYHQQPKLAYELQDFYLTTNHVVPLGIILTELLTNSLKYAFADHSNPVINIAFTKQADKKVLLIYRDNGPGFDIGEKNLTNTFGLKLIKIQAQQLKARTDWKTDNEMEFRMAFGV